jgi:hypothetical protein
MPAAETIPAPVQDDEDDDEQRRLAAQPIRVSAEQPRGNTSAETDATAAIPIPNVPDEDDDPEQKRWARPIPDGTPPTKSQIVPLQSSDQPAAATVGKSSGVAPIGSTEDLENKAAARTIPRTAAPETGSTEDLESKADTNNPLMRAGLHPVTSGVASLWSRADNIHNPVLRVLAKVGAGAARAADTVGSIVAPGAAAMIPGSTLNSKMSESRQRRQDTEDIENNQRVAQTGLANAETQEKQNPPGKAEELLYDKTGAPIAYRDPDGKLHAPTEPGLPQNIRDVFAGASAKTESTFEKMSDGTVLKLSTDPKTNKTIAEPVYKGDPKVETDIIKRQVGGQLRNVLINKGTGADIRDLGVTKEGGDAGEHAMNPVIAYDDKGQAHLVSEGEAASLGLKNPMKATDKQFDDAQQHTSVLNDLQAKLNDVASHRGALDQNVTQRGIIAKALADNKNTTYESLLKAGVLDDASDPTIDYIQSVLSLRESALGLPKELTGGSRVSEVQASALWATLPSAGSLNSKYALQQTQRFQQNIDRLRKKVPQVKGNSPEQPIPELQVPTGAESLFRDQSGQVVGYKKDGKAYHLDGTEAK